ncbi:hypothetical protein Hanom_Chr06g00570461 [Helianthus anomalus]
MVSSALTVIEPIFMAGPGGGRGGPPARARYFKGHIFYEKNLICTCKIFFLIGYTHINTNIGPFIKLFQWFILVINPFDIWFRPLVSPILNFVKDKGTFFELEQGTRILRAGPANLSNIIPICTMKF